MVNVHAAKDILFDVVVGCSILHSTLPPWDFLNDFPRAQKVYKAAIYLIGYIAINARSTVYKGISTQTIGGVNESVNNAEPKP
jgi:hypothetical protein